MMYASHYESPLGGITLASDGTALTGLWFDGQKYFPQIPVQKCGWKQIPVFERTFRWLDLYFDGKIPDFTPTLEFRAGDFRKAVWNILLTIPYGKTMTYGEIAKIISRDRGTARMSAQAVGGAVGRNPIALIVPCHRVIGSDGSLTGYAGGIGKKKYLLDLEGIRISGLPARSAKKLPC